MGKVRKTWSASDWESHLARSAKETSNRKAFLSRILTLAESKDVCEVGVWRGELSAYLLEHCPDIHNYTMVDPWRSLDNWNKPLNKSKPVFDEAYRMALAATDFAKEKRRILRSETLSAVADIPDNSLDVAYIDGDHTLRGILIDLIKMYPKVRSGGIIIGDDFSQNAFVHGGNFEPTLVFPTAVYFAEAMDKPIYCLPYTQFAILKQEKSPFLFNTNLAPSKPATVLDVLKNT
ncbi:MAG: class I SAM-dependent methyltransferase [Paracoccaceae bacterium]